MQLLPAGNMCRLRRVADIAKQDFHATRHLTKYGKKKYVGSSTKQMQGQPGSAHSNADVSVAQWVDSGWKLHSIEQ